MKHKPTAEEARIIRASAIKSAECGSRVLLKPGIRYNTDHERGHQMNIALVSDHPDWDDTDLWHTSTWADFRKGVELTDDGRGIFDFYVYDHTHELRTNVVAYYEGGKLARVTGVLNGTIWPK